MNHRTNNFQQFHHRAENNSNIKIEEEDKKKKKNHQFSARIPHRIDTQKNSTKEMKKEKSSNR